MDKKDNKNDLNDVLSFDELKEKIKKPETFAVKNDDVVENLLTELGGKDQSHELSKEADNTGFSLDTDKITDNNFEDIDSGKSETEEKEQRTKALYDEIISAVENTPEVSEATSRRSKYSAEEKSFVDVTNIYQKPRVQEAEPVQSAVSRSDKKKRHVADNTAPVLIEADDNRDTLIEDISESDTAITDEQISSGNQKAKKQKAKKAKKKINSDDEDIKTFNEVFKSFIFGFFPTKHDKASEIIRKVIMDISVFTLIGCGIWFGVLMGQKNSANKQNESLKGQVIDNDSSQSEAEAWQEFFAKYPNVSLPEGMKAKYAYLYAINNSLVGWVKIPNSAVDVQVVQAQDNEEYLKKDFYGNYSRYGCPFMDYRNDPKYLSQNTIIYGHHMSDGLVFAELDKYKKLDGFKESPIIEFDTLFKTYKYKVYAAFIAGSSPGQDNGYLFNYISPSFGSQSNFEDYIKALDERSLYSTGVSIDSNDKLITLSTCSYEFSDARLVVVGRLLRDGESETVDSSLAKENENPRYPQIWYDKNGKSNPFKDAEKWFPENS